MLGYQYDVVVFASLAPCTSMKTVLVVNFSHYEGAGWVE